MAIECYYRDCKHHSSQTEKDEGPYCYEKECLATKEQIVAFSTERDKEIAEWSKVKKLDTP